jgi:hypothetical protein
LKGHVIPALTPGRSFAFCTEERLLVAIMFYASAVQRPERIHPEPLVMATLVICSVVIAVLLVVDIPVLPRIFTPTAPIGHPLLRPPTS